MKMNEKSIFNAFDKTDSNKVIKNSDCETDFLEDFYCDQPLSNSR